MRLIRLVSVSTSLLVISCNNSGKTGMDVPQRQEFQAIAHSSEIEKAESDSKDLYTDSINNLSIGDCFVLKAENLNTGFILTRMRKGLYDFTPVNLDHTKKGLSKFSSGNFRMVPIATTGIVEEWGTECLSLMGQDDVKEFFNAFKKTGHLEFKEKAPQVSSSAYLPEYTSQRLNGFLKQQEAMWVDHHKTAYLDSLIVKK